MPDGMVPPPHTWMFAAIGSLLIAYDGERFALAYVGEGVKQQIPHGMWIP